MKRAHALVLAAWLGCAGVPSCTVDQRDNPAYRACSDDDGACATGEHCHLGYCVPDDDAAGASARPGTMREQSPLRGEGGSQANGGAPARGGSGARRAPEAGNGQEAPRSPADAGAMSSEPDAAGSTPRAGSGAPSSPQPSDPPADPPSQEPPPTDPPDADPPPAEPPPADPPPSDPDPAPQCTLRAETCNRADEDCDGKTDEGFLLQSDPAHCGACGRACPAGESCCAGTCVDTQRTPAHCGECGHECTGLLQACCTGACKTLCLL